MLTAKPKYKHNHSVIRGDYGKVRPAMHIYEISLPTGEGMIKVVKGQVMRSDMLQRMLVLHDN